jgi:glycine oxidase
MGPSALPGLVLGTGHFRNGILLTPVSADVLTEMLVDGTVPEEARPFTPDRFEVENAGGTAEGSQAVENTV